MKHSCEGRVKTCENNTFQNFCSGRSDELMIVDEQDEPGLGEHSRFRKVIQEAKSEKQEAPRNVGVWSESCASGTSRWSSLRCVQLRGAVQEWKNLTRSHMTHMFKTFGVVWSHLLTNTAELRD